MNEVQGFVLEGSGVRGAVVRLEETWRQVIAEHSYTPQVRALLGEGVAATVLLASGIKARPSVSLQLQGEGPLRLLVIQCADGSRVRGMAHCSREPQAIPLLGAGRLVVNVDTGRPNGFFQGIVPLMSDKLDECLEAYFEQSEQLATRLILKTSERRVAGLLLQMLPGHDDRRDVDAFEDAAACAATVSAEELTGPRGRAAAAEAVRGPRDPPVQAAFGDARLPLHARNGSRASCGCSARMKSRACSPSKATSSSRASSATAPSATTSRPPRRSCATALRAPCCTDEPRARCRVGRAAAMMRTPPIEVGATRGNTWQ